MAALRWIALLVLAGVASADDSPPTGRVQGFVAPGTGELTGRVTDAQGNPVKHATVHVITKDGETTLTTDADGKYRAKVTQRTTLIVVHGDARINGTAVTSEVVGDGEAIHVKDVLPPAKFAKALSDPEVIPEYTMASMDQNPWARAWLLLEISNTGVVSRVKLINPPGYELDQIAIRDAFKLKFEPARDRSDKPISTQMLWTFEWPAFWWMNDNHFLRRKLPHEVRRVPCRDSGPTHDVYRDCTPANLVNAIRAPWIDRPRK